MGSKVHQGVPEEVFEGGVCRAPGDEEAEEDLLKEG